MYTRSTGATRASNREARQATFDPRNRPGMTTEVMLLGGMCITGHIWYAGRMISRNAALEVVKQARADYLEKSDMRVFDDQLVVETDSGNVAVKLSSVKRLIEV